MLPLSPLLHPERAHLVHPRRKGREELGLVLGQGLHDGSCSRVQEQRLVRQQQSHLGLQVAIVRVVEGERRLHVERCDDVSVAAVGRAGHLEGFEEPRIDDRVGPPGALKVVEPAKEMVAMGETDGVGAGKRHQVLLAQPLLREETDEFVHGGVGAG